MCLALQPARFAAAWIASRQRSASPPLLGAMQLPDISHSKTKDVSMNTRISRVLPLLTLLVAVPALAPRSADAASGTINFTGEIVQSTCDVITASRDQTVVIGRYPTTLFKNVGDTSASKAFNIGLENCEPGTYTIRFDGITPTGHPDLLAVSTATGVGIELLDNNDKIFPINQEITDSALVSVGVDGLATVHLKARYKSFLQSVTAGEASASSEFSIEYR